MANHKSAIKRHKQSLKKREHNRVVRASVRTSVKKTKDALTNNDMDSAKKLLLETESALSKAAAKGILHKKNAARRISRLAKMVNKK